MLLFFFLFFFVNCDVVFGCRKGEAMRETWGLMGGETTIVRYVQSMALIFSDPICKTSQTSLVKPEILVSDHRDVVVASLMR
jgi:hypothetical protein